MSLRRSKGMVAGFRSDAPASYAKARINTTQGIAETTFVEIDFDEEVFDTDDYWEGVTNPERLTAPVDGVYRISGYVNMLLTTNDSALFGYWVNGAAVSGSDAAFGRLPYTSSGVYYAAGAYDLVGLDADDWVSLTAYASGTTRDVVQAHLTLELLDPL